MCRTFDRDSLKVDFRFFETLLQRIDLGDTARSHTQARRIARREVAGIFQVRNEIIRRERNRDHAARRRLLKKLSSQNEPV